ncbi:MAG: ABC transporter permease [Devosiaceae bacterium]|nr:ABC transporter permease [Devosiaceae bacterium MH13]
MDFIANWLLSTPAFAVPFVLAALGIIITEKAGVLNLGAEGFMLVGAMAGVGAMLADAGPFLALGASALAGVALGFVFAIMVAGLRINHVIAGLILVFGAHAFTSFVATTNRWTNQSITGLEPIFLGQDPLVFLTPLLVLATVLVLDKTRFGLSMRAVGENPAAADAAGFDPTTYRYAAILIGGALLGLAGGYLTVAVTRIWVDGVIGGRGWIAVALVIFARWYPWRALLGALLFGCIEALIPRIAATGADVPRYFLQMTPYLATLIVMIWSATRARSGWAQPGALGTHYVREDRT